MRFLITGTAGFIGFHLARRLLDAGHVVHGLDGLTSYYDVTLKERRHDMLRDRTGFTGHIAMLEDAGRLADIYGAAEPEVVIHLAAQAGVRYSLKNPRAYVEANFVGTFNLLERAREHPPRHLLLASTSSVYGANPALPFREADRADHPLTIYAATKKATELLAHSHSHAWSIPTTVLRFFTVYGPWGRPDMALFRFAEAMLAGRPIDLYGEGRMTRDFTYVDDVVEALVRLVGRVPARGEPAGPLDTLSPVAPYRVVNVGGGRPVELMDYVRAIERALGRKAILNRLPMQLGDVPDTRADPALLEALTGYRPSTPVEEGVRAFCEWYRSYNAPIEAVDRG